MLLQCNLCYGLLSCQFSGSYTFLFSTRLMVRHGTNSWRERQRPSMRESCWDLSPSLWWLWRADQSQTRTSKFCRPTLSEDKITCLYNVLTMYCGWMCGCAGKTVKSLENTCHTWALLRWWFTTKRRYINCMHQINKLFDFSQLTTYFQMSFKLFLLDICRSCEQKNRQIFSGTLYQLAEMANKIGDLHTQTVWENSASQLPKLC